MDKLSMLLAALAALSLATERITETIKGLPILAKWFATEQTDPHLEEFRKASIHILAIAVGTFLASQANLQANFADAAKLSINGPFANFLLGAMASSGSGFWNSALDIVRQISKQKEIATDKLKST